MARKTQRAPLTLTTDQRNKFEQISKSRTAPLLEVQRAKIILHYADGLPISQIQEQVKVSRPSIYKCIDKALAAGPDAGLKDHYHRPFDPTITVEAKAWVVRGILAALDLHDGRIIAQVHDRHRSCEFIELLKELDDRYPPECTIRVVLDNHSAHI
ncbi:MAG: helix-turn-helix domain-containing protein, partial [Bacteroidales bacterium]|nr:helix-turn-helix domain-containing protein [Bacteroidales bacterium]